MSSDADLRSILRRLKPERRREPLQRRSLSDFSFVERASHLPRVLLYDTTVYIDILQGRFPNNGDVTLRAAEAWHSPVTEAELVAAIALLDPTNPQTPAISQEISAVIERRPTYRTIVPDAEVWREAGLLSGILARLRGYGKDHMRRLLNDSLLFASARKHGCSLLTRNVVDFDFLQQLDPSGDVLFYK